MPEAASVTAAQLQVTCPYPLVNKYDADRWGRPGNPDSKTSLVGGSCALACPVWLLFRVLVV